MLISSDQLSERIVSQLKRKSPIRHWVDSHFREGKMVRPFIRGIGQKKIHQLAGKFNNPVYLGSLPNVNAEYVGTIGETELEGFALQTDGQDVDAIKEHFGNSAQLADFEGFFVKVGNGDYDTVYAFSGTVPGKGKSLYKITLGESSPQSESVFSQAKKFGTQYAKAGAKRGIEVAKKAAKTGAESIRESVVEAYTGIEQNNVRTLINESLYSPKSSQRNLSKSVLKNYYPEVYATLNIKEPDRKQNLVNIAKQFKAEREALLKNAPEYEEEK